MCGYHPIPSCVAYQAYEFELSHCSLKQFEKLRAFVQSLGENLNPPTIGVLHVAHPAFFISFPSYGYPVFKISFYPATPADQIRHYLNLLSDYTTHDNHEENFP